MDKCPKCGRKKMSSDYSEKDDQCAKGLTWTCSACGFVGKADAYLFHPPGSWYFHRPTVAKIKSTGKIDTRYDGVGGW